MSAEYSDFGPDDYEQPNGGRSSPPPMAGPNWSGYALAGVGRRIASYLIDVAAVVPIMLIFDQTIVVVLFWLLNTVVLQGITMQSVGKMATKMILVRPMHLVKKPNMKAMLKVDMARLALRQVIHCVESLLGVIFIAYSRRRQSLADMVCQTICVEAPFKKMVQDPSSKSFKSIGLKRSAFAPD